MKIQGKKKSCRLIVLMVWAVMLNGSISDPVHASDPSSVFVDGPYIEKEIQGVYKDITGQGLQQGLNRCTIYAASKTASITTVKLIIGLYKEQALINCAVSPSIQLTAQGQMTPLSVQMNVPAVTEGLYMKVYLWDDMQNMRPLATMKKIDNLSAAEMANEWIKIDDTGSMVTYDTNWQTTTTASSQWFRKTRHETAGAADAKATFIFSGTKARVYGFKNNTLGKFAVYLDNRYISTIDCYDESLSYDILLWESEALSNEQHKVEVVALNQKNANSSSTKVIVDAFSYYSDLVQAYEWKVTDDTDVAMAFGPGWSTGAETGYYQDTVHYTEGYVNAAVSYSFNGGRIRCFGSRGTDMGKLQVRVDGVDMGIVDCYHTNNVKDQILWESRELSEGNHTLEIIALDARNISSTGTKIAIDAVAYYRDMTTSQENRITSNAGFESDYAGWDVYGAFVASNNSHSGSKAMGMGYSQGEVTRKVGGLKPNTPYILSVWAKVGTGGSAALSIKQYDGANGPINASITHTQYTHISIGFNTGANNTDAVISLSKDNNGATAWADDFTLIEGTSLGGYKLVWNDEFNGADNSPVDGAKWRQMNGDHGSNELQYYTSRLTNGWQEHGKMVLMAQPESYNGFNYTSGWMDTLGRKEWTYGKFEVRAKLPYGKGIWPAIWLMPRYSVYGSWPQSGEIDMMELIGHDPDTCYATLHSSSEQRSSHLPNDESFSDDYHVWTLEWEPGRIRIYVDGALYMDSVRNAPYDQAFYLILNIAVGGTWPGSPNSTTVWPQKMYVDYVRIYQK